MQSQNPLNRGFDLLRDHFVLRIKVALSLSNPVFCGLVRFEDQGMLRLYLELWQSYVITLLFV